jgi:hypothetical protein
MQVPLSCDAVVVSHESFRSDDPSEIVGSNISFVNALFEEYLRAEEVSADALRSYVAVHGPRATETWKSGATLREPPEMMRARHRPLLRSRSARRAHKRES